MGGVPVRAMWMTLLAVVAILPMLAIVAAIGLGRRALETLAALGLRLGRRLQAFERFGRSGKNPAGSGATAIFCRVVRSMSRRLPRSSWPAKRPRCRRRRHARCDRCVNILLGNVGQVEVDDMTDAGNVDPACRDVGRDEHLCLSPDLNARQSPARAGAGSCCRGSRSPRFPAASSLGEQSCRRHAWCD